MRFSLLLATMLFVLTPLLQAQEIPQRAELQQLISQLGAENYSEREAASQRLLSVGIPALGELRASASHVDLEIRQRCRRLVSAIAQSDLQLRLELFLADTNSEDSHGLPLWTEFRSTYGDTAEVRSLFVEVQQHEASFLQAIAENPANAGKFIEQRSQQLQEYTQQEGQNASLGSIVALLATAGIRHKQVSNETHPKLFHLCHQIKFQEAIRQGPRREILRGMLGTLVRDADNIWSLYYVLDLAMKYDLKEGLPQAIAVLENAESQAHIRQLALLTIGKLGDDTNLPLVEKLFSDEFRTGSYSINDHVYHQQIRDLALAVAAHMRGYKLETLGFDRLQRHPYTLLEPSSIGFESDTNRNAAFAKYAQMRGNASP